MIKFQDKNALYEWAEETHRDLQPYGAVHSDIAEQFENDEWNIELVKYTERYSVSRDDDWRIVEAECHTWQVLATKNNSTEKVATPTLLDEDQAHEVFAYWCFAPALIA